MGNISSACGSSKNNYNEDTMEYDNLQPQSRHTPHNTQPTYQDINLKKDIDFEGYNNFEDYLERSKHDSVKQVFIRKYSPPKSPSVSHNKELEFSHAVLKEEVGYDALDSYPSGILTTTRNIYSKTLLEQIKLCPSPLIYSELTHLSENTNTQGIYSSTSSGQVFVYNKQEKKLAPQFSQILIEVIKLTEEVLGKHPSAREIAENINRIIHQKVKVDPAAHSNDPELDANQQRKLKLDLKAKQKQIRHEIGAISKHNNKPESIDAYLSNNYLGVACRESSLLAHFTLAYFGIESWVISASSSKDNHGRHAIVDVPSANTAIDPIQGRLRPYSKSKYPAQNSSNIADNSNHTRTWKNTSFYHTYNEKIVIQQLCSPKTPHYS